MDQRKTSASSGSWFGKVAGWLVKPARVAAGLIASAWRAMRGANRPRKSTRQERREEKRRRKDLWRKAQAGRRKAA